MTERISLFAASGKAAAILFLTAALALPQGPDLYNRNLVMNGDAESGPAAPDSGQSASSIPGWKPYNGFTVMFYGEGTISPNDEGPKNRGKNYFIGGRNIGRSYAEQTIQLGGLAPGAKFYLSAFIGRNYGNQDSKNASLTAVFLDDNGQTVQQAVAPGPPNSTEYGMAGGLQPRSVSGFLLPGVTQVKLTLDFGASDDSSNALVADNLSLMLTREPLTGANLMVNGNAEQDTGTPVPGWNGFYRNMESKAYAQEPSNYELSHASPGPSDRGKSYFWLQFGGDSQREVRYWQSVDIARSPYLAVVDAGQMRFQFSAWMGVDWDQPDEAKFRLSFLDGKGATLGTSETPVMTGLQFKQKELAQTGAGGPNSALPQGTRQIRIELIMLKKTAAHEDFIVFLDNVSLVLSAPPQISIEGAGNGANYVAGKVSPGEVLVVYGTDFGPAALATLQLANGRVSSNIGNTRVYFDGVAAPLIYSIAGQLSCLVPYSVSGKSSTQVQAEYLGVRGNTITIPVVAAVPGLFTLDQSGKNQVAALHANYSVNGAANPAARGDIVVLFGTGEGQTSPAGVDGQPANSVYPKPLANVTAQIGGKDAEVAYAGAAPTLVAGVLQVNVKIPLDAPTGNVPVVIKVGNESSQSGATLAIR